MLSLRKCLKRNHDKIDMSFQKGHKINLGKHWKVKDTTKNSLAHKGKHSSPRTEFKKGQIGWSRGKHLIHSGSFKKGHKPYPGTENTRFKKGMIPWCKGKKGVFPEPWNKGKHLSEEIKKKLSDAHKGKPHLNQRKKEHKTDESKLWRTRIEYRLWRESVFARDNWTCQKYRIKGGKLHPHHIQNFAQFPELRFAIDNGITLSEKAHKVFHRIYGNKNNTKEQLEKFLCQS